MSQQPTSINDQSRSGNVAIHSEIEHRLSIVPRMSSSSKRNSPAFWLSEELLRLCIVTRNRCPEVPLALKARFKVKVGEILTSRSESSQVQEC